MIVRIENSYATCLDTIDNEKCIAEVMKVTSYFIKSAIHTPAYQNKIWDGRKNLFDVAAHRFPVGLITPVLKVLKKHYAQVGVQDVRAVPTKRFNLPLLHYTLRDYQEEAVEKSLTAQRGTLVCPTGSGKTLMAMAIAQRLGIKTLFIVNTKEALYDTVKTAEECFDSDIIGQYGDRKKNFGSFITIATMSMLVADKKDSFKEQNFQCLFIDEVHHAGADTWFMLALKVDAYYKFGLTGTNFRSDGSSIMLQAVTGRVIIKIKTTFLQAQGYLSQSKIIFINCAEPTNLDRPLRYPEIYEMGIVRNTYRHEIIQQLCEKEAGKSILIAVEKLEHGRLLLPYIKQVYPNAVFIEGKSKQRKELKEAFTSGELKVVIASRIYNESVDIPILDVVINAAGGKAGVAVIQRVGRALRPKKPGDIAIVYDFNDLFNYKMELHAMERMKWLKKEGHEVIIIDKNKILGVAA